MLKFAAFDNSGLTKSWRLSHAHVIGAEELVIPGQIDFQDGYIIVEKKTDGGSGAAGLGLLFPTEPVNNMGGGQLVLRTCLLPQRAEPYLLSLELARQKVMTMLCKLEEWAVFDRSADEPALKMVDRAREAFTAALLVARKSPITRLPYSIEADVASRVALNHAVAAGEALSLLQARIGHQRRCSGEIVSLANVKVPNSALTDDEARDAHKAVLGSSGVILPDMPKLGVRVNPNVFTPALCDTIQQNFDFISLPMRWVDMEPSEGKYAFAKLDKWIEWAVTKSKLPVHAGAVIDLHPRAVPGWLSIWEHDYETLRDVIFEHVKNVVTRYRRTVNVWTIVSSLNVGGTFKLTYEQTLDLTRSCVLIVRKLQPTAKVHVEIAQPFSEHAGQPRGGKSIPAALYCELMNQTQTNADAYAMRLHAGQAELGRGTRALVSLSTIVDRIAGLDKPIAISLFGCPSAPSGGDPADNGAFDPGTWRGGWTDAAQADWASNIGAMLAGKLFVQSICWQDLIDQPMNAGAEMPSGGLLNPAGLAKPAIKALAELRQAMKECKPLPTCARI